MHMQSLATGKRSKQHVNNDLIHICSLLHRHKEQAACKQGFASLPGASNLAELNRVLNSTVMVRRLKSEVLDQLPPKRRQHVRPPDLSA